MSRCWLLFLVLLGVVLLDISAPAFARTSARLARQADDEEDKEGGDGEEGDEGEEGDQGAEGEEGDEGLVGGPVNKNIAPIKLGGCMDSNGFYAEGATLTDVELETCQKACEKSRRCNYYTWNTITKGCGLRDRQFKGILAAPSLVTGAPYFNMTINDAVFVSNVLREKKQSDCYKACKDDSSCQSWTWFYQDSGKTANVCYLNYDAPEILVEVPEPPLLFVSGRKNCNPDNPGKKVGK